MKKNLKKFFKPTTGKIALTIVFLGWQYFFSYQNIRSEFLSGIGGYITNSLSVFNWGGYFGRNISLFFIWILVAVIIYIMIWFVEITSASIHNFRIARKYVNQPKTDYQHLLRDKKGFLEHLRTRSLWIAGIFMIIISFFTLADSFEQLRSFILEGIMLNAFRKGTIIDPYSIGYVEISFVVLSIIWYLVVVLIFWIFDEEKTEEYVEKIGEEHYAVSVDNPDNKKD